MGAQEIELVKRYNHMLQETWGDFERMRSELPNFLAADATLDEAGSLPWGGHWVGIDGYMTVFETVHAALKNHDAAEMRQVTVDATQVALEEEYFSDGSTVFMRMTQPVQSVELFEIVGDRISNIEVYMFDTAEMAQSINT